MHRGQVPENLPVVTDDEFAQLRDRMSSHQEPARQRTSAETIHPQLLSELRRQLVGHSEEEIEQAARSLITLAMAIVRSPSD
jgi:hypothetical protein